MKWSCKLHGTLECGCQVGFDMRLTAECRAHRINAPVVLHAWAVQPQPPPGLNGVNAHSPAPPKL